MKVYDSIVRICDQELGIKIEINDINEKLIQAGIDSIALMTLIVYLEEEFSTEIKIDSLVQRPYSELTFNDLIQAIQINE